MVGVVMILISIAITLLSWST